jgi:hypothetical protein
MLKMIAAAILLSGVAPAAMAESLTVVPPFEKKKEAENLSGVACARPPTECLLVSDEMRFARTFAIVDKNIALGIAAPLLSLDGEGETDAEGIAYWNNHYYFTGSHGLSKGGEMQPSRFFVYRTPVGPDGRIPVDANGRIVAAETSDRLRAILATNDTFKAYAEKPLTKKGEPGPSGVNIEGLAVRDDVAYFAFRGPVLAGKALVLPVPLAALFGPQTPNPKDIPEPFHIGSTKRVGLRDIAAVRGGFLLLTGPEADEDGPADVRFWNGSGKKAGPPVKVERSEGAKPEALLVLAETATDYDVLVLSDGPAGGDPRRISLSKAKLRAR